MLCLAIVLHGLVRGSPVLVSVLAPLVAVSAVAAFGSAGTHDDRVDVRRSRRRVLLAGYSVVVASVGCVAAACVRLV